MVIDQVLGVEGASLDIPIEQIPYAKVPVPYSDQLVLPQPSRGLIHPDDAPPVLANLNAMPSSGALQAEELHSTNHALNVNMVGGGGGSNPPMNHGQSEWFSYGGVSDYNLAQTPLVLYLFTATLWLYGQPDPSPGFVTFTLHGLDSSSTITLGAAGMPPGLPTSSIPAMPIVWDKTWPGGLDATQYFIPGEIVKASIDSSTIRYSCNWALHFYGVELT